jgi:DNA-binding NtrC family response regulator
MANVADNAPSKINSNGSRESLPSEQWQEAREAEGSVGQMQPKRPEFDRSLRSFRDEAEVHAISSALERTEWNRKRAARLLSISYRGLLLKIRRHNITPASGMGKTVAAGVPKVD